MVLLEKVRKAIKKLGWRDFIEHWFVILFLSSLVLTYFLLKPLSNLYFEYGIPKWAVILLSALLYLIVSLIITVLFVVFVEGTEPPTYNIPTKKEK